MYFRFAISHAKPNSGLAITSLCYVAIAFLQSSIGRICMNYSVDKIQYPVSQLLKCGLA